ncbi:MAG TPA: hypothetical protein VIA82_09535, partial [Candidatus Limnocylindria bacterium]
DNKDTFAGVVHLKQNDRYSVGITWSNWCADRPLEPIHLYVTFPAEWNAAKEVSIPGGGVDAVPPCLGSSQSTNLSVTDLQKAQ